VSLENAKAYIHGDTFPLDKPDGFYIVSYDNQNMGFVKATQAWRKTTTPKA
jgi:NOL1/NOP2/fmu family ribosome biogenesis protein